MLLRHRTPVIDTTPAALAPGLEHLDQRSVAVLRWLNAARLDFVLVGPVAYAIRGELTARGPVAVVPAPYHRNHERLAAALSAHGATTRGPGSSPVDGRAAVDALAEGRGAQLRVGGLELDVESTRDPVSGSAASAALGDGARYQELLYEAVRVEVATGVPIQVAAPEDLEHYAHLRRTGSAPEFRVSRGAGARAPEPVDSSDAQTHSPDA